MEKFGFKEISIVEERLRQNVIYFEKIKRRVIVLVSVFCCCITLIFISQLFIPSKKITFLRTFYTILITCMVCCAFFVYLSLRNGRYLYLKKSYRNRVNKILKQYSLSLTDDSHASIQFDSCLIPNVNYNYNLYKLEAESRSK